MYVSSSRKRKITWDYGNNGMTFIILLTSIMFLATFKCYRNMLCTKATARRRRRRRRM
jgi:hypothetical protein